MKKFSEYLSEDFDPAVFNADGAISIKDPSVLDSINSSLEMSTSCGYRTPYNALEEVRKVLAYYKIFLPKSVFLDQNHGNDVFEVSQFGEKMGMNDQGEVVTADDSPLFIYFEWSLNEKGMYDTFAALVDQTELDEILADYDAEVADEESELTEEHSMASKSKMLYKVVNQAKAMKQKQEVEDYVQHENQGKTTFTQMNEASSKKLGKYLDKVNKLNRKELKSRGNKPSLAAGKILNVGVKVPATNEESMPDLKKKMGAKKVTLSNMMKKEETQLDELAGKSKEAMKAIKKRLEKKHDAEWDATHEKRAREKLKGSEKTKEEDKSRNNLAKRWLRADKAEKKLEEEQLDEISKKKLGQYIKAASHDVATKSAATGRYADRANRARDEMKKGDYKNWPQGKKDDEFADKMFKKSWNRRKGIAKAVDKLTKE